MEKIQELTEKIYHEGVEKGQQEADRLIAEAKAQAEKIVAEAKEQAQAIENVAKRTRHGRILNALSRSQS